MSRKYKQILIFFLAKQNRKGGSEISETILLNLEDEKKI